MKKALSILLAVVFAFGMMTLAYAQPKETAQAPISGLAFNQNGKFKIMYICDIQDKFPMNEATLQEIGEALDASKPDLVVLGGDNMVCEGTEIYAQLLKPFTDRGVKFTFVFGNHDEESSNLSKEEQLAEYQKYPGCLAYDAVPELHGTATHNLPIMSSDGTKVAFNLWMFDSGDYATYSDGSSGYDCVRKDQLDWYKEKSKALETANGGNKVPSLAFEHIIVKEVYDSTFCKMSRKCGILTRDFNDGTSYFALPDLCRLDGLMFELPCPSSDNDGQWDAFVERGDVLGCAFGHDHVNCYIQNYRGIDIIQTPSASFQSYCNNMVRGVRLFTINENDPWNYDTEMLTASELALKDGSKIREKADISRFSCFISLWAFRIFSLIMG